MCVVLVVIIQYDCVLVSPPGETGGRRCDSTAESSSPASSLVFLQKPIVLGCIDFREDQPRATTAPTFLPVMYSEFRACCAPVASNRSRVCVRAQKVLVLLSSLTPIWLNTGFYLSLAVTLTSPGSIYWLFITEEPQHEPRVRSDFPSR